MRARLAAADKLAAERIAAAVEEAARTLAGAREEAARTREEAAAILSAAREKVDSLQFESLRERYDALILQLKRVHAEAAALQAELVALLSRSDNLDPPSFATDDGEIERPALNPAPDLNTDPELNTDRLYSARLIALPMIAAGQSREQITAELERQLGPDGIGETLDHVLGRGSEL